MSLPTSTRPFSEIHHRLLERYAPPSLLVDAELEIVHASDHARRFLLPGESQQLLVALPPALRLDAICTIYEARRTNYGIASRVVRYDDGSRPRAVCIRARVADLPGAGDLSLILFEELATDAAAKDGDEID